jgi:integrase/recombinase XerD
VIGRRPITQEEQRLIADKLGIRERAVFLIGIKTGFRISEILSLNVTDAIDECGQLKRFITVKKDNMKGKKRSRSAPLHSVAYKALDEYLNTRIEKRLLARLWSNEPLFKTIKGRLSRQHFHNELKLAAKAAGLSGVEKLASHSMRKSFAQEMLPKLDWNIFDLQHAMGHANVATTTRYLAENNPKIHDAILR